MNQVNSYPPEYRTPPLPLIALLGCPEHHKDVGDYLVQQHRSPLVSLSSAEPLDSFVPRVFGPARKSHASVAKPPGIFKADWFTKHRGKRPAVALAFVSRGELAGDPNSWNAMLYALKMIRDATQQRGAGMVVAVIQDESQGELPQDRITAVCHNLSIEPRLILPLAITPGPGAAFSEDTLKRSRASALTALGKLVHEQCVLYYGRCSRRVSDKLAERRAAADAAAGGAGLPGEFLARCAFKLAVYAEFCQDWASAVTAYSEAYQHILTLCPRSASARSSQPSSATPGTPSSSQPYTTPFGSSTSSSPGSSQPRSGSALAGSGFPKSGSMAARGGGAEGQQTVSLQRYVEVCKTAELAHLKLLMLLLHQGRLEDAAGQAREHHAVFLEPLEPLCPVAAVHHLSFRIRQYLVAAELLGSKIDARISLAPPSSPFNPSSSQPGTPPASGGSGSSISGSSWSLRDCTRGHLLTAAATASVERRRMFDGVRAARNAGLMPPLPPLDLTAVKRGLHVGQLIVRREGAAFEALRESDYLLYLETEEGRANPSLGSLEVLSTALSVISKACAGKVCARSVVILTSLAVPASSFSTRLSRGDLLRCPQAAFWAMHLECGLPLSEHSLVHLLLLLLQDTRFERLRSHLGMMMAGEHMAANNLSSARKLLLQVAQAYRRDCDSCASGVPRTPEQPVQGATRSMNLDVSRRPAERDAASAPNPPPEFRTISSQHRDGWTHRQPDP
ncbi:MAG: hypothetical protein WDW38_006702 [Sanguina aurantia]